MTKTHQVFSVLTLLLCPLFPYSVSYVSHHLVSPTNPLSPLRIYQRNPVVVST